LHRSTQHPHDLLSQLEALHGPSRHPTLVPCHARPDRPLLTTIFDRLSLPLSNHPLVMIGNQPIVGDAEGLEELRGSGRLASMLGKIGWRKEEAEAERGSEREEGWKPKLAVVKKKEMGELDMALRKQ